MNTLKINRLDPNVTVVIKDDDGNTIGTTTSDAINAMFQPDSISGTTDRFTNYTNLQFDSATNTYTVTANYQQWNIVSKRIPKMSRNKYGTIENK